MGVETVFVVHGVNTATAFYSQLESGRVATNTNILTATPSGHHLPLFRSIQSQGPAVEFTTSQLASALGDFGYLGLEVTGVTTSLVDLYEKKVDLGGTREAAGSSLHNRYRITQGLGYIASITAPHQGVATADVRVLANYDGTNEPILPAGSEALVGTPTASEYYGCGPIKINDTDFPGIQSIGIDFAVSLIELGSQTEVWDTFKAIASVTPVVTFTAIDATAFTTLGLDGTAISSAVVYLRKKASEGTNVADATEEHISFTFTGGIVVPDDDSGGGNDPVTTTYRYYPTAANGTAEIMVIDTTAAITAAGS